MLESSKIAMAAAFLRSVNFLKALVWRETDPVGLEKDPDCLDQDVDRSQKSVW
jgi:hypothetical protein